MVRFERGGVGCAKGGGEFFGRVGVVVAESLGREV